MRFNRRETLAALTAGALGPAAVIESACGAAPSGGGDLTIKEMRVTPIALPDPPILAASGCHGPYFLRNIVELETVAGITGIGETRGGAVVTSALNRCRRHVVGKSALAYRSFAADIRRRGNSVYAGIELACLDAVGRATGRRLCELLGGPVCDNVEFAAYLFYRYAADHPTVLNDERIVDDRGRGDRSLDDWGEVRTPEAMAEMAWKFHQRWGFTKHKLKAGVLSPAAELETMRLINQRFDGQHPLRIDPNGRWTLETALMAAEELKKLPLEYYEDPVRGQPAMAEVRRRTGLPISTNSCVTRFSHIGDAVKNEPIDIVLCDHHGWGGITACQSLGVIADSLGWTLSQHSNNHGGVTMAAMIHVGAVTPQIVHASDTHYVWLVEGADIIDGPNLKIENGRMQIPPGPGVGVNLDRDKLARAHETYQKCGMRERDDATMMRRMQPGWERNQF